MRQRTGDWQGANTDLETALASARRSGDHATEMETLNELGIVQLGSDVAAAASFHEAALAIAQELGDAVAQTNELGRRAVPRVAVDLDHDGGDRFGETVYPPSVLRG